jgi:hypothetical protein
MYILYVYYMFVLRFILWSFTLIDKPTMLWNQRYIIKRNSFSVLYVQSSPKMKHLKTTEYFIIAIALPTRSYFSKQSATMIFCSCKSSISLETYDSFEVICLCVYVYLYIVVVMNKKPTGYTWQTNAQHLCPSGSVVCSESRVNSTL